VAGFDAIHICYVPESGALGVIRTLHQKQEVRRILERDWPV
jgi:hypothetical protein